MFVEPSFKGDRSHSWLEVVSDALCDITEGLSSRTESRRRRSEGGAEGDADEKDFFRSNQCKRWVTDVSYKTHTHTHVCFINTLSGAAEVESCC